MPQCVLGAAQAGSVLLAAGVIAPSCQPPARRGTRPCESRQGRDPDRDLDPGGIKSCASPSFRHVHALDDQAYKLSSLAESAPDHSRLGSGCKTMRCLLAPSTSAWSRSTSRSNRALMER